MIRVFVCSSCAIRHKHAVLAARCWPRLIEFLTGTFHFTGVNEDKDRAFLIITFHAGGPGELRRVGVSCLRECLRDALRVTECWKMTLSK